MKNKIIFLIIFILTYTFIMYKMSDMIIQLNYAKKEIQVLKQWKNEVESKGLDILFDNGEYIDRGNKNED